MTDGRQRTAFFDYDLPNELIAQAPAERRDSSRLMVVNRSSRSISHTTFDRLPDFLEAGDLLVFNRSRVIRARLRLERPSGARAEVMLLRERGPGTWTALVRPSRKLADGTRLRVAGSDAFITVAEPLSDGQRAVRFDSGTDVRELLRTFGEIPLPPYIRGNTQHDERYQTVYADQEGSVAAPTAGLHFTDELLEKLRLSGVQQGFVTLHVGAGTFKPVTADFIDEHTMHSEWGEVPSSVAAQVNATRAAENRVVAVGTTSTRLLETAMTAEGMRSWHGDTDRFITPGYTFSAIDALVTNFHLPRSTLLMLVSAFAGHDIIVRAYDEAIRLRYRFFSFGDAMLIL